jgi:hypothetical protein
MMVDAKQEPAARPRAERRRCTTAVVVYMEATGPPKGNKNAFKHGRYTAQAITCRREVRALLVSAP